MQIFAEGENDRCKVVNIIKSFTWYALLSSGRYLFLNAIANQLRYPNSHTHYFSCVLLYLFAEANTEAIQEQITRYVGMMVKN